MSGKRRAGKYADRGRTELAHGQKLEKLERREFVQGRSVEAQDRKTLQEGNR